MKVTEDPLPVVDGTAWMLDNPISEFFLMHTHEVKFMCMIGYCFFGGVKVFSTAKPNASLAYKFIYLVMTCTGGGIFVPIFLNKIPVPMADDYYIIAILTSFSIHHYFPVIREVYKLSPIFQALIIVMYETNRAFVVCKFTGVAGAAIAPTAFFIPLFGPIMCGAVAGCGGAFLPLNKGLEPAANGLAPPMLTALLGATAYHLYVNTSLSAGCTAAAAKARVHVVLFFIAVAMINTFGFGKKEEAAVKGEKKTN